MRVLSLGVGQAAAPSDTGSQAAAPSDTGSQAAPSWGTGSQAPAPWGTASTGPSGAWDKLASSRAAEPPVCVLRRAEAWSAGLLTPG
jgi:hypothetical protein